jgi:hypothetical protein
MNVGRAQHANPEPTLHRKRPFTKGVLRLWSKPRVTAVLAAAAGAEAPGGGTAALRPARASGEQFICSCFSPTVIAAHEYSAPWQVAIQVRFTPIRPVSSVMTMSSGRQPTWPAEAASSDTQPAAKLQCAAAPSSHTLGNRRGPTPMDCLFMQGRFAKLMAREPVGARFAHGSMHNEKQRAPSECTPSFRSRRA